MDEIYNETNKQQNTISAASQIQINLVSRLNQQSVRSSTQIERCYRNTTGLYRSFVL